MIFEIWKVSILHVDTTLPSFSREPWNDMGFLYSELLVWRAMPTISQKTCVKWNLDDTIPLFDSSENQYQNTKQIISESKESEWWNEVKFE